MKRREFLAQASLLAGAYSFLPRLDTAFQKQPSSAAESDNAAGSESRIAFETSESSYRDTYSRALDVLARNVVKVSGYPEPVLNEGSSYLGVWLESGPQEGLVYSAIRPEVARSNHLVFFALQREDGQIPCWARTSTVGFAQIQTVVPIAATAWEVSQQNEDEELLEKAYGACGRWDAWLRRYRDTRHTGLCEGFCAWDTGHDNSPRWAGLPNRCPDGDARKCPQLMTLPRLSPDLSATVYGRRVALAAMARALGKNAEADRWLADADSIRTAILSKLYSAEDAAFYDLDSRNHYVRVRGDVISRVLGEHVVDKNLFETIYRRQIHNPAAFWATYPLPSIALDDPTFVRPIPRNTWGGASQALTALRAPRWMEHYGRPTDLAHLMLQWTKAILRQGKFLQQMDPLEGTFTPDTGDYSPAALVFLDFTWRLSGVRREGNTLQWNIRPPSAEARATYRLRLTPTKVAQLQYESGQAELSLNGKTICKTSSTARLNTDLEGRWKSVTGLVPEKAKIVLQHPSKPARRFTIEGNHSVAVAEQ